MFKKGELVTINSEEKKIVYVIEDINNTNAFLKGFTHRVKKCESLNNLEYATNQIKEKEIKTINRVREQTLRENKTRNKKQAIFGTILHIDGDETFLASCMELYKELDIYAWGLHMNEKNIKNIIVDVIDDLNPDIIVLTGHDFYNGKNLKELTNYENSVEYMTATKKIRQKFGKDDSIVIAGACSSNFEALIASGANFASSPKRINVHTYDPAVIAIKCATTPFDQNVNFENTLKYIINGRDAYGGIETKGKMRLLL